MSLSEDLPRTSQSPEPASSQYPIGSEAKWMTEEPIIWGEAWGAEIHGACEETCPSTSWPTSFVDPLALLSVQIALWLGDNVLATVWFFVSYLDSKSMNFLNKLNFLFTSPSAVV